MIKLFFLRRIGCLHYYTMFCLHKESHKKVLITCSIIFSILFALVLLKGLIVLAFGEIYLLAIVVMTVVFALLIHEKNSSRQLSEQVQQPVISSSNNSGAVVLNPLEVSHQEILVTINLEEQLPLYYEELTPPPKYEDLILNQFCI